MQCSIVRSALQIEVGRKILVGIVISPCTDDPDLLRPQRVAQSLPYELCALQTLHDALSAQPISGHNAFYTWGTHGCNGQVVVTIGLDPQIAIQWFGSVTLAAGTSCVDCASYENNAPTLILRDPKESFAKIWEQLKHFH